MPAPRVFARGPMRNGHTTHRSGYLRQPAQALHQSRASAGGAATDAGGSLFDLLGIPPYNQDDEGKPPGIVTEFKARIRAADAILIATPE